MDNVDNSEDKSIFSESRTLLFVENFVGQMEKTVARKCLIKFAKRYFVENVQG